MEEEGLRVEARTPYEDDVLAFGKLGFHPRLGPLGIGHGGNFVVDAVARDAMVVDFSEFFLGWTGHSNAHFAVELTRVRVENAGSEVLRQCHRQSSFARSGRAMKHP